MLFRSFKPAPALSNFIENFWLYEGYESPHFKERIFPTGTFELVFNLRDDELRIYKAAQLNQCERLSGAIVSGPYNGFFLTDAAEEVSVMGVHFKPGGAYPFLGVREAEASHELYCQALEISARQACLEFDVERVETATGELDARGYRKARPSQWSGGPDLSGSFGRNDDFGLQLLDKNPGRILAEQRLGQFHLKGLCIFAEQRLGGTRHRIDTSDDRTYVARDGAGKLLSCEFVEAFRPDQRWFVSRFLRIGFRMSSSRPKEFCGDLVGYRFPALLWTSPAWVHQRQPSSVCYDDREFPQHLVSVHPVKGLPDRGDTE